MISRSTHLWIVSLEVLFPANTERDSQGLPMISIVLSVCLPAGEKDSIPGYLLITTLAGLQSNVFPFLSNIQNF